MLEIQNFCFNPFGENTYVVYGTDKNAIVIDPGNSNPREDNMLFAFIDSNNLMISKIINTHAHIDHIIGNKALSERYSAPIAAHPDTTADFATARQQLLMFGFDSQNDIAKPDEALQDGDTFPLGDDIIEVIPTPGHARGSISLYAQALGVVFTGDALFCRSIGRTDFPGGSYEQFRTSIRERLFTLPDNTTVFSGHGECTTIGEEKDFNPYVAI